MNVEDAFYEYKNAMRSLNKLIEYGEGDSLSADHIRADMDFYWRFMTEDTRSQARQFGVELDRIANPVSPQPASSQSG